MSTIAEQRSSTMYIAVVLAQKLILPLISGTIALVVAGRKDAGENVATWTDLLVFAVVALGAIESIFGR